MEEQVGLVGISGGREVVVVVVVVVGLGGSIPLQVLSGWDLMWPKRALMEGKVLKHMGHMLVQEEEAVEPEGAEDSFVALKLALVLLLMLILLILLVRPVVLVVVVAAAAC
ncbi:hypothetical protein PanWU01x14_245760 [Parasponia andersonii]|uniref:Transmembrane protein n=1 Tax=Parasponia andersonii TaxID=3476 RepID=A0A2P5BEH6_PARAD|nr:hypothetical protein PanWU01x14_245760 [Parasponia andersonii]